MGSDRARISYNEKQQYRSVVMQQGRVTVEADWNEAQSIASEETRAEALDIVGPAGTPDDGYAIKLVPPGFDFQIGKGTMYVGGVRAVTDAGTYGRQPDWLDSAIDPDWVPVPNAAPAGNEYVYLLLREQEVSGVEDNDLKDVALGGPDTAQRTRLIQHVTRLATTGTDCATALADAEKTWRAKGFAFDPADMRVNPLSRLKVGFVTTGGGTACDPASTGGYLGADNQLIRVQISSAAEGSLRVLWGYDDASFLYRVSVNDPQTLTLQTAPVDADHIPQGNQAVEVLMDAAKLSNGQYVAATTGQVFTLATSSYNADTKTLSLPSALNVVYGDGTQTDPGPPQVYLRVWEQELSFTRGTALVLGDTGVAVTLSSVKDEPFRAGDYWTFAVRPGTPQHVYPERYAHTPQAPEGPREWICPLAVILWAANPAKVVNCRNPFDGLVALSKQRPGGCCTVNVSPENLTGGKTLQTIADQYSGMAGVNICLAPGTYTLDAPLELESKHGNLHFAACAGAVIFAAAADANGESPAAFLQGLVVLNSVDTVGFEGIQFQLPVVRVTAGSTVIGGAVSQTQVDFSIGIRLVNSTSITIGNCQFEFVASGLPHLSVAILAAGVCNGLQLTGCELELAPAPPVANGLYQAQTAVSVTIGFVLVPTTISSAIRTDSLVAAGSAAQVLVSEFQEVVFRGNTFAGLTLATLVYADIGAVRVEGNTVRDGLWGLWFFTLPTLAYAGSASDVATAAPFAAATQAQPITISTTLQHPDVQFATSMLRGFPLPQKVNLTKAVPVAARQPLHTLQDTTLLRTAFERIQSVPVQTSAIHVDTGAVTEQAATTPTSSLATLNQNFNIFEKLAFPATTLGTIPLAMYVSGNDVRTAQVGGASGLGFLLWDLGTNDQDVVNVTGNVFVSNGQIAVVGVAGVAREVFAGNVILNDGTADAKPSLWLAPVTVTDSTDNRSKVYAVTVTGNVFRGPAQLPGRNLNPVPPAPMNTWHFFNSET